MITAIIVEDEKHCEERLVGLIKKQFPKAIIILGSYNTVDEAQHAITTLNPSLVFLDVQLGQLTGFDLLERFNVIDFKLIFTTAYDKFALQAIKFSTIDYLLKPIESSELAEAITKVVDVISLESMREMVSVLGANLKTPNDKKILTIASGNKYYYLPISDIIRCQSNINYTTIYTRDQKKIIVAKVLKEYEELLADYNFFRVHNSELVNLTCVKSYTKGKGGSITLIDGTELEVSTRRKEDFIKKMKTL
ncbi:MAG: response regulator transcription factor [Flavobacterium sp.]|nr:MAG: response regulator transcription factor [Flavobacterium sp.]